MKARLLRDLGSAGCSCVTASPEGPTPQLGELKRLERMEKHSEGIRKHVDGLGDEIRKGHKALDGLLRHAQSTLRALNIELSEETVERSSPIALPNGSLDRSILTLPAGAEGR